MWRLLIAAKQVQAQADHFTSPEATQSGSSYVPSCALQVGSGGGWGTCTVTQSSSEL